MRKYCQCCLRHYYATTAVTLLFTFATFLLLGIAFQKNATASGLLINLAASTIFALITIFGIEFLRKRKEQYEFFDGESSAAIDALRMTRMLIWWGAGPLGENVLDYKVDGTEPSTSYDKNAQLALSKMLALDMDDKIRSLSVVQWNKVVINLRGMKQEVDDYARYYSVATPRNVYAAYLSLRRKHMSIERSFSPSPFTDLFLKDKNDWPANKYGQKYNEQIRESMLIQYIPIMQEYFKSLDTFHKRVVIWANKIGAEYS